MLFEIVLALHLILNVAGNCERNVFISKENYANNNCSRNCYYKTLDQLDMSVLANNTCIYINDDQLLHKNIIFENLNHVFVGKNSTVVTVDCADRPHGFDFINTKYFHLKNIRFIRCGHPQNSTSISPRDGAHILPKPNITTVLYFKSSKSVTLENLYFHRNNGYSIAMYDVGGFIDIGNIASDENNLVSYTYQNKEYGGFSSGGSVYIEYTVTAAPEFSENVNISIHDSRFNNNTADFNTIKPEKLGLKEPHISFGRGGAIGIIICGKATNIKTSITNCSFDKNEAAWGSAVYIRFRDFVENSTITMTWNDFTNNRATYSGGAIFSTTTQETSHQNNITIEKCNFTKNSADIGGAYSQFIYYSNFLPHIAITNSTFESNQARFGSAIALKATFIELHSVRISNGTAVNNNATSVNGQGAIYLFKSTVIFSGSNNVDYNNNTALVCECTKIFVKGALTFTGNMGENGGAVSLYGKSFVVLSQATELLFRRNSALRNGGAVFVQTPGVSIGPNISVGLGMYKCFFRLHNGTEYEASMNNFNGNVTFSDNTAKVSGSSIYITTLDGCTQQPLKYSVGLLSWKGFTFYPNLTSVINTRAVNISTDRSHWEVWPGKVFSPIILLLDELNNTVSEPINVAVQNQHKLGNVKLESSKRMIANSSNMISLVLLGNNKRNYIYDVVISLAWRNYRSLKISNLTLQPCYFGYTLGNNNIRCQCNYQKNQDKGIAYCYDENIYLFKNRWAYPAQTAIKNDDEVTAFCPDGYCRQCTNPNADSCLYKPNNQCIAGRNQSSILCSECNKTKSVLFGSEECEDCRGRNVYAVGILLLILIGIFLFVLFMIWLNIDIYYTYLHGFFYYYQTVYLLTPAWLSIWEPTKFIIGVINLKSPGGAVGRGFCLFDNFNNLHKNFFNYYIPFCMVVSLYGISLIARRWPDSFFCKKNCVKAFTIVSVIAYADVVRISFMLLNFTRIDDDNNMYVWVYAKIRLFSGEHLPFAIIAILVIIFIVLGFPVVLICYSELSGRQFKYFSNPFVKMYIIVENFHKCYKHKFVRFSGYYFFCRVVLLGTATFLHKSPKQNMIQTVVCLTVCVVFTFVKPYHDNWMNFVDITFLFNLVIVSILSLASRSYFEMQTRCFTAINVLLMIPLIVVIVRLMYLYLPRIYSSVKSKYRKFRAGGTSLYSPLRPSTPLGSNSDGDDSHEEFTNLSDDDEKKERRYVESIH